MLSTTVIVTLGHWLSREVSGPGYRALGLITGVLTLSIRCERRTERYDFGMTRKIAVSLPDEQVEMIQRAVQQGRAASVSGFISQAVARAEREDSLRLLLEELDRELGAVSAEDLAWADRELGLR